MLKQKTESRQAVIQLFDSADLAGTYKDVPCTCVLQFMIRSGRVDLVVMMRSNDAYFGLPHDVFSFTMLQEIVARILGVEVGGLFAFAGSLHLYDKHVDEANSYLDEGFQGTEGAAMPPMPTGDPWPAITVFRRAEKAIRLGQELTLRR